MAIAERHVLVVSTALDLSTDAVVRELGRIGVRCTRLNSETYPFATRLTVRLSGEHNETALQRPGDASACGISASSVWFRRVRSPERLESMSSGVYDFCLREARSTLIGAASVGSSRVMSEPANVWRAEHKIVQLRTAAECGMRIPDTVVTNDPVIVERAFREFGGDMIAKPARSGFVDYGDEQHAVYTTRITEDHLSDLDAAKWSPVIYQPLVPKRCDVRVTYVAGKLFVAEIDSQSDPDATVDWRRTTNPALPHRIGRLPAELEERVHRFMGKLGLRFGALDFVCTPEGDNVFLEVNPNGQWLWLEDQLGFPISAAIAQWLALNDEQT